MFAISNLVHHLITGLPHRLTTELIIPISISLNTLVKHIRMHQLTRTSLVQIMAFCETGGRPSLKPMMVYCQLGD